jgi:3-methyladenine DNA glycosylase AlkD
MNLHHQEILKRIQQNSGTPTKHTFSDSYLGNEHPRYPISNPVLRSVLKEWMNENQELSITDFTKLLTSLFEGVSSTEKSSAGMLLDYATPVQKQFNPKLFNTWLNYVIGWVEVDSLCTSKYTSTEITTHWKLWKPLLIKFSKSKNIQKRRASLVLLCVPLRKPDNEELVEVALQNIERLKDEKEILITKAISWVLRSMIKHYHKRVSTYLTENKTTLPAIAVRETMMKLKTGRKNG